MERNVVDATVKQYDRRPSALIAILQDIQAEIGYLPTGILKEVAVQMDIPLPQIYGVATFFKSLHLTPQGKHTLSLCMGTACHVKGADKILKEVTNQLDVRPGETTQDGEFTFMVANCLGACAIGPVVVLDGEYHGKMSPSKVKGLLAKCRG